MAYPSEHFGLCSNGALSMVLALLTTFLTGYIVRLQLYSKESSGAQASCSCHCDCSGTEDFALSLPLDCSNHDPDVHEEMEKDIVALLSEEIALQRRVANESLEHTRVLLMDARTTSLHYQREAEKCTAQTETCEEARERAEAELVDEYKLAAVWEQRARGLGWEDNRRVYT